MTADYARAIEMHRIDLLLIDGEIAALIEMIAEPRCLLIESIAVEPRRQGPRLWSAASEPRRGCSRISGLS
jgi:hypothetical protein